MVYSKKQNTYSCLVAAVLGIREANEMSDLL